MIIDLLALTHPWDYPFWSWRISARATHAVHVVNRAIAASAGYDDLILWDTDYDR